VDKIGGVNLVRLLFKCNIVAESNKFKLGDYVNKISSLARIHHEASNIHHKLPVTEARRASSGHPRRPRVYPTSRRHAGKRCNTMARSSICGGAVDPSAFRCPNRSARDARGARCNRGMAGPAALLSRSRMTHFVSSNRYASLGVHPISQCSPTTASP